ncbi:hypothetical protein JHK82_018325 [Glycine max]|nr:hypothetical protein JHK85_018751 [Glycine max]KAG5142630.1 hypothetical protein JHK82_018325 [Glycine max]
MVLLFDVTSNNLVHDPHMGLWSYIFCGGESCLTNSSCKLGNTQGVPSIGENAKTTPGGSAINCSTHQSLSKNLLKSFVRHFLREWKNTNRNSSKQVVLSPHKYFTLSDNKQTRKQGARNAGKE